MHNHLLTPQQTLSQDKKADYMHSQRARKEGGIGLLKIPWPAMKANSHFMSGRSDRLEIWVGVTESRKLQREIS